MKTIAKYLMVLVCVSALAANAEELTQTNATNGVVLNVTAGASSLTTWKNATDTDSFQYGGQIGLSLENVFVKHLEVGVRQSFSSVSRPSSYSTTTTTTHTTPDQVITTTTTTPNPGAHVPNGNAWGWWRNGKHTTTTTTTTTIPGETITETSTTTVTDTKDCLVGQTELFADYNLELGKRVTLYAGANASLAYGEGMTPVWFAGPEGGVKVNLTEKLYAYGRVNYDFQLNDRIGNSGDSLRYGVGIGFRF